ncbi:hypothetical protein C5167_014145 [Papaver somniferum]|uniref:RIN4 pathogenic type III effector avirulence factor Avr cleavage site domain-containing protein n=1 Tax=Papaver somniferum TaxID=3469 RepID=A0A4Y7J5E4_PAPSO|nr:hypothetical protein C5167_014145 [Papaver somniferum]
MEDQREKNGQWLSVPQFGDWDQKGGMPDYSMDFTKIREMRKQNKRDPSRASLGNEDELVNPTHQLDNKKQTDRHQPLHHTPTVCSLSLPILTIELLL